MVLILGLLAQNSRQGGAQYPSRKIRIAISKPASRKNAPEVEWFKSVGRQRALRAVMF